MPIPKKYRDAKKEIIGMLDDKRVEDGAALIFLDDLNDAIEPMMTHLEEVMAQDAEEAAAAEHDAEAVDSAWEDGD